VAIGLGGSRFVFLLYSGIVVVIRSVGARIPDVLGPERTSRISLLASAVGLAIVALWRAPGGVLVGTSVFAVGSALATTAGVLGGPIYGARPGLDATVLILALVVVVIGGLGSVRGALVGALIIGQVDTLGRVLLPEFASFVLFGALALVLVLRPQGLFGSAATVGAR
jgi:hypothetical protein